MNKAGSQVIKVHTETIKNMSVLQMYRYLMKNLLRYPTINKVEVYLEVKRVFHQNKMMINSEEIEKEIRKARLGVAHVEAFIGQNEQLFTSYRNTGVLSDNSLNPKDKGFVYF